VIQVAGERARRAKVGVFGIGLAAYWEQFTGLQERLGGYQQSIEERMGRATVVVRCGRTVRRREGGSHLLPRYHLRDEQLASQSALGLFPNSGKG
jgi:hypothetical protein